MKKICNALLAVFLVAGLISISPQRSFAQPSVSFQVFYDQLSPYGRWVNYPRYGYVWVPTSVSFGFRPYATAGHWVYTPEGWTWVSDYPWGWAAFHYGNWFYDNSYGWMWLPGYDWAPAWVTWGEYGDDYCWAPIGPQISIGVSFVSYRPPAYCWTFVPRAHMTSVNINNYYVNRGSNTTVIKNITVINNVNRGSSIGHTAFMRGPSPENVEEYTRASVHTVQINQSAAPGRSEVRNGQLALYHPAINRNEAAVRPAPNRVTDMHQLRSNNLPAVNRNAQPNNHNERPAPNRNVQPNNHAEHPAPAGHAVSPRPNPVTHPVNPPASHPKRPPSPQPNRVHEVPHNPNPAAQPRPQPQLHPQPAHPSHIPPPHVEPPPQPKEERHHQ